MHLYLSSRSPWNTTYCAEDGQSLYKTETPFSLRTSTITILRAKSTNIEDDPHQGLRDSFEKLAEIQWDSLIGNNRIRYRGKDTPVSDFFRKTGLGVWGRHRVFIGPDGREYMWKMKLAVCKLFVKVSGDNKPVARFHRRGYYFYAESRPSFLEIFPEGEHMVDLIMITFIYMEKLRKQRERRSRF